MEVLVDLWIKFQVVEEMVLRRCERKRSRLMMSEQDIFDHLALLLFFLEWPPMAVGFEITTSLLPREFGGAGRGWMRSDASAAVTSESLEVLFPLWNQE